MVHGGPGETQPGGVVPGVSHLLFGLPGLNMLLVCDDDPVMFFVMSVILTIHGEEHGTRAFQEPEPTGNWDKVALVQLLVAPIIDERKIPARRNRAIFTIRTRAFMICYPPRRRRLGILIALTRGLLCSREFPNDLPSIYS